MTHFARPLPAALVCALAMALAPPASADEQSAATTQVNAEETQCGGVASWVRVSEGMSVYGNGFAEFRVEFPSPTAACSGYYAAADTNGNHGAGGSPVDSGPYAMTIYCRTTMAWWWQVPWSCNTAYGLAGTMEWSTGGTTLYRVENGTWQGGAAITFGNRVLPTGSGEFFPSRWTSTFALTGDYVMIRSY